MPASSYPATPSSTAPPPAHPTAANPSGPPPLLIIPWIDPVVAELGYDPRSPYVERFWLPVLGPTSTWMIRHLADEFDKQPEGFALNAVGFARSIGVGGRGGRQSPLFRSIDRCIRFGLIREEDHGILAARSKLPAIDASALGRLPRVLRDEHRRWQRDRRQSATTPATDMHAVRLARSLLDVGATPTDVVQQLQRWNFEPGVSQRALRQAGEPGSEPDPEADQRGLRKLPSRSTSNRTP